MDVPFPGSAGRRVGPVRRSGAAANEGGDTARDGMLDLLGTNEMDVSIDPAGGDDASLACDDLGGGADGHGDAILNERVARMTDADDAPRLDADVRLDDSLCGVEDERVGDDEVERFRVLGQRRLGHADRG